ncbi:MAG: AraC family transcriptional regulator [Bacteroidales bacterium]|nr:AraC family transcriptional regulator [Bacteroidales bacterium]
MYRLRDFLISVMGDNPQAIPSDELACTETNLERTFYTNKMQDSLSAYTYTLVDRGWLNLKYNNRPLRLERGDLYIYSPGFQVSVESGSDDFHTICLLADENMTLEMPAIRDIIRTAYLPVAEWGQPVVRVPEPYFGRLWHRMTEIIEYQHSSHRFRDEALRTLYTLFVLDLTDIQERAVVSHKYSERITELFIGFMRLLPKHFVEHHDIGFYASELCITTTHLSRIVRQITGRTVVDYINQMLLMEASWLLRTTDLSIAEVAERLHFADQSSFGKFFQRRKGVSPKAYRK